jgi:hypothetical protein
MAMPCFGDRRICYNNFAEHLLNAYNPNVLFPGLPYAWSDADWRQAIDMLAGFGFNVWEFWLVPRLFCRTALQESFGEAFTRQIRAAIDHAHARGLQVEMICALTTVGPTWQTLCPNVEAEWQEVRFLWDAWTRRLPGLDIVGLFPGDPGGCSLHGCTAETYIDRTVEIAGLVKANLPAAEIEVHTWGPPFFGWGVMEGPVGWQGEFVQSYQHTGWRYDARRAESSMRHLQRRLADFPTPCSVALNMGFDPDGNPSGERDARAWCRELARQWRLHSWDFSLTEGENNIAPHYRFARLFERRRAERDCGAYSGGICYTMTPRLNQLSLYEAAQSFLAPDANPDHLARDFYERLFGPAGREIVPYLPLFEVVPDWGNYQRLDLPREEYHRRMRGLVTLLRDLQGQERSGVALFPAPDRYREELLFFAELFADLSGTAPDYAALGRSYWERVYRIYDHLPEHVDPRPRAATRHLLEHFAGQLRAGQGAPGT